jgi:FixJ family two-component response regulator
MDGQSASVVHVVDGDPAVRDSLTTLLDLNGFRVETYATGAAFLKELIRNRSDAKQDWVVCEADLPDGSGIEVFSKVRDAQASTPFILLISRRNPGIIETAKNAGIEQIFQKPLVHRNLLTYIEARSN